MGVAFQCGFSSKGAGGKRHRGRASCRNRAVGRGFLRDIIHRGGIIAVSRDIAFLGIIATQG